MSATRRLSSADAAWLHMDRPTPTSISAARHLHRRVCPPPGDEQALKDLAGDLASMSLDRGKPLWDVYLIDGPGAGCAVIVRMHHCIADGIALAQVMLSLTDLAPNGELSTAPSAPLSRTSSRPMARLAPSVEEWS